MELSDVHVLRDINSVSNIHFTFRAFVELVARRAVLACESGGWNINIPIVDKGYVHQVVFTYCQIPATEMHDLGHMSPVTEYCLFICVFITTSAAYVVLSTQQRYITALW